MNATMKKGIILVLISIVTSFLTSAIYVNTGLRHKRGIDYYQPQVGIKQVGLQTGGTFPEFTTAAEKSVHAVVHIKTQYQQKTNVYDDFYGNNPLYDFFFGPRQQVVNPPIIGFGSGVIITDDGYIVTNNHVVQDADVIDVTLNDKRTYSAKLIGNDPSTDLALIKIEEKDLPFLIFGNSDNVKIGEWVLAVGNPFNLTSTVTAGIVSAKARNINILGGQGKIESFIQTDAAVNQGNSGGALVNTNGELIGINAAIASNTGSFTGYSFAIPSNIARKVVDDFIKYGEVQRAYLGIASIKEIDKEIAEKNNIKQYNGIYINSFGDKSAARDAGIREGDIITHITKIPVNSLAEMQEVIAQHRPGDEIDIKVLRQGKEITLSATLKNINGTTDIVKTEPINIYASLGASFQKINRDDMYRLGLSFGMKITKLEEGRLRKAGIRESFIITHIDKQPINSEEDIKKAFNNKKGGVLVEGFYPNGLRYFYAVGM